MNYCKWSNLEEESILSTCCLMGQCTLESSVKTDIQNNNTIVWSKSFWHEETYSSGGGNWDSIMMHIQKRAACMKRSLMDSFCHFSKGLHDMKPHIWMCMWHHHPPSCTISCDPSIKLNKFWIYLKQRRNFSKNFILFDTSALIRMDPGCCCHEFDHHKLWVCLWALNQAGTGMLLWSFHLCMIFISFPSNFLVVVV